MELQHSLFDRLCPLLIIRLLPLRVFDDLKSSLVYGELLEEHMMHGILVCLLFFVGILFCAFVVLFFILMNILLRTKSHIEQSSLETLYNPGSLLYSLPIG